MNKKIAICPGSFDPVTLGHVDIIERASLLFDSVIVAVSTNTAKQCSFTVSERMKMIETVCAHLDNVFVDCCDGLMADYAKEHNSVAIVKGLRAVTDFEYEFQQALINKKLYEGADTLFLTTRSENMYLSSSVVKEVASFGGDISEFIPKDILPFIQERLLTK